MGKGQPGNYNGASKVNEMVLGDIRKYFSYVPKLYELNEQCKNDLLLFNFEKT